MITASTLHLAIATDSRYLAGAIGTLAAIRLATPLTSDIEVICLHESLSAADQSRFLRAMARLRSAPSIRFLKVDADFGDFPDFYFGSTLTYARLVLPNQVEQDRLIYIDVDLLVLKNLLEIQDLDLSPDGLAGVAEQKNPTLAGDFPEIQPVPLDPSSPNLNGGLYVLDLEKIRRSRLFERTLCILRDFPKSCRYHDQSAVNYALNGRMRVLDASWNTQTHRSVFDPVAVIPKLADNALNVHFISKAKPWLALAPFPADVMFRMLLDSVDPTWREEPFSKKALATCKDRHPRFLPLLFGARALLRRCLGQKEQHHFDLLEKKRWLDYHRDVKRLAALQPELKSLYHQWQSRIDAVLAAPSSRKS